MNRYALGACALLALVSTFTTGCFGLDLGLDEWFDDESEASGNLTVRSASLTGAIADVEVRGNATQIEAWGDSGRTEVTTTVESGNGAAMTIVEVSGSVPEVRAGEVVTVYDSRTGAVGRVDVNVLGCSGPEPGYWHYDGYADHNTVLVERRHENPRVLRYSYISEFSDYDGSVTVMRGSFDLVE